MIGVEETPSVEVSVIVPLYNAASLVAQALDSIAAQTRAPAEIIVVDDASTDGGAEVARAHPGVRCVTLPVNRGQAAALNTGVAASRGRFLAFLDADDVWRPQKLELQLARFAAEPPLDLVYGLAEERVSAGVAATRRDGRTLPAYLPSALLARRAALLRVGPFDESYRIGSVIDWHSRALAAGLRIAHVPEVVYERRIHGANLGLTRPDTRAQYLSVVRAALERRRQAR